MPIQENLFIPMLAARLLNSLLIPLCPLDRILRTLVFKSASYLRRVLCFLGLCDLAKLSKSGADIPDHLIDPQNRLSSVKSHLLNWQSIGVLGFRLAGSRPQPCGRAAESSDRSTHLY